MLRFAKALLMFSCLWAYPIFSQAALPGVIEGAEVVHQTPLKISLLGTPQPTVIVFLSARCPCSASHEGILKDLARTFKEFSFIGIHSNVDEDLPSTRKHFMECELPFPVIQDRNAQLADQFQALKTPHVFVVSPKNEILFEGGVDDSRDPKNASTPYLKLALSGLREGKKPQITRARTLGCAIRRSL